MDPGVAAGWCENLLCQSERCQFMSISDEIKICCSSCQEREIDAFGAVSSRLVVEI